MTSPRSILSRLSPTYFIETGWLAAGFISKLLIQMGTLYYLTKSLGRDGTGTFFALIGLLACLVPFVQLGNYDLTIRAIARREDPQTVAGRAMRSSGAAFLAFLPVLLVLRLVLAKDVGWTAFLLVATSELLVMRVISNVQAVATGFRLHYVAAVCDFLLGAARFVAVFATARLHAGVDATLTAYAFTALPAALAAYVWMVHRIGPPHYRGGPLLEHFADHRRMVVGWLAEMAAGQGDKPLLKAVAGAGEVGIYGTASKLFAVAIVPIDILTQVFRPRVGQAYADGEDQGRRLGRQMALGLCGLGVVAGAGLFTIAWLLPVVAPRLIPPEFADARLALMYLAVVPPLYALQRANAIIAIARGKTGAYSTATAVSAVAGLTTLALTAPHLGWRGACLAYATYLVTGCVAISYLGRREAAADAAASTKSLELATA